MNLLEYVKNLNSCEDTQGIWVNPENIDDFRIGQLQFENGGILDNFFFVGTLNNCSFGYQSIREGILTLVCGDSDSKHEYGFYHYKGKQVKIHVESLIEAYFEESLDLDFYQALNSDISYILDTWADEEASLFIENLQNRLRNRLSE